MAVNSHLVISLMNIYYSRVTHAATLPNRGNPGRHMLSIMDGQKLSFREDLIVRQTITINREEFFVIRLGVGQGVGEIEIMIKQFMIYVFRLFS